MGLTIIGGTPGVGKTTVAKKLAKELELDRKDLMEFAEEIGAIEGKDEERDSLNVDMKKVSEEIPQEEWIIDSHMGHLISPEKVEHLFILRCSPPKLKERLETKNWSEEKIEENVRSEIMDSCLVEAIQEGHTKHTHEIDTSSKEVNEVVREIKEVIDGEREKGVGKVDWSSYIEDYM